MRKEIRKIGTVIYTECKIPPMFGNQNSISPYYSIIWRMNTRLW